MTLLGAQFLSITSSMYKKLDGNEERGAFTSERLGFLIFPNRVFSDGCKVIVLMKNCELE